MPESKCKQYFLGKKWTLNGKPHREDGPAIEWQNGDMEWYINGERHREDGPAIEWHGTKKGGGLNIHRDGTYDGLKEWWIDGKRHREDGPAIELWDGAGAWYLKDKKYKKQDYFKGLEKLRGKEYADKIRLIYA